MKKLWPIIMLSCLSLSFTSFAAELKVSGIYSNLRYHQEAGDLLGEEIIIFPSNEGYSALVQIAEGGFPYAALIPVKINGNKIEFSFPNDGVYSGGKFTGIITDKYIEGHFSGTMHSGKLKLNINQEGSGLNNQQTFVKS